MLLIIREGVFLFIAVVFQYLLMERKWSRKKTLAFLIPHVSLVFLLNVVLILNKSYILFFNYFPLTVILPVCIPIVLLSRHKSFKVLFNVLTAIFLAIIIRLSGYFFSSLFSYSVAASLIGQILTFPFVLFYLLRFFRPSYIQILDQLKKGWIIFCLVPLTSYVLIYFLNRYTVYIEGRGESIFTILVSVVGIILYYAAISTFFRQMQLHFTIQNEQNLLKSQITALQNQLNSGKESQEKYGILRHDIRHHTQITASLIATGDTDKAIEYISKFNALLDDTKVPAYCENPTINAVLAYYIENAKKEDIAVKTRLDIPIKIPIDEMELSTVFANAMENARNACRLVPAESHPAIELVCVKKQHFVFECANTFVGTIVFDESGIPVSQMNEHGIGTKSIVAFVKKHNAILDYQVDGNIFRMRILIS